MSWTATPGSRACRTDDGPSQPAPWRQIRRRPSSVPSTTRVDVPLKTVTFALDANATQPVAFEWQFDASVPPFMEGPEPHAQRLPGGHRPRPLSPDRAGPGLGRGQRGAHRVFTRDHGCRPATTHGECVTTSGSRRRTWNRATPGRMSFRMIWSPIAMERPDGSRYGLFLHYQIFQGPGFVHKHVVTGGSNRPTASRCPSSTSNPS